jgi:solute carrier family 25 phosphate transporter 23/24/25/41
VSRTAVAPLERLRTMMMATATGSLPETARRMWADGGVRGLFKGNLATVTKVIPQTGIQMAVYDSVKDYFQALEPDKKLTNLQRLAAGTSAGAASTLVTYPMENLRTHVSLGRKGGYMKILSNIYQDRGLARGVYGGFGPCMVNTVTTVGLGFFSYELGCDFYKSYVLDTHRAPTPGERGVIAGCSAIGVMAATMPLEVMARRMQIQGAPGHPVKYNSMVDCVRVLMREEGPKAFYRGTVSSWMKVVPSIAIVRYMYEVINAFTGQGTSIRSYRGPRPEKAGAEA